MKEISYDNVNEVSARGYLPTSHFLDRALRIGFKVTGRSADSSTLKSRGSHGGFWALVAYQSCI